MQAGALVDAKAEGEVFFGAAVQDELVGALEDAGVAVGGADAQGDEGSGGKALAAEFKFDAGAAVAKLVAGFKA